MNERKGIGVMQNVQPEIRIHVFHTGRVCVSPGLPFKDAEKNPNPVQLTLLSSYGRKQRLWLPVSAYLIEHPQGKILVDTGWHREISPKGEYSRWAQIRHLGLAHYLLNQGVLPMGEALVEQLARKNIQPKDIDYVLLTHLHSDHASGLRQLKEAKHILVSEEEWQDTKAHAERYVTSMWKGVNMETFAFVETGQGPVGRSFDLFGDGSVEMIQIPGHTSGLAAVKISHGGKFVLLFADGGYAEKSWKEMIPPGTALDAPQAYRSLQWIREMSQKEECLESLANHDINIIPHEIVL